MTGRRPVRRALCNIFQHVLSALSAVVGLTILIIILLHLRNYGMINWGTVETYGKCLLGGTPENPNLCNYVISVLVFSWLANIAVHMLQCFTCNLCGLGGWADCIVSMIIAMWWAVACGVVGVGVGSADGQGVPEANWRHAVLTLMWVEFFIFLTLALCSVGRNSMKRLVKDDAAVELA